MGRIDILLDDKIELEFRTLVAIHLGGKKGTLSIAGEEAIKSWNKHMKKTKNKTKR